MDAQRMATDEVRDLLATHRAIGEKYRKALATFDPSNHLAGHAVDDLVAGIETGPLAKTEALLQKIENPARSVAVEDAISGVQSAAAGGFGLVVGVDRGAGEDALLAAGADVVVSDLAEFVPEVSA